VNDGAAVVSGREVWDGGEEVGGFASRREVGEVDLREVRAEVRAEVSVRSEGVARCVGVGAPAVLSYPGLEEVGAMLAMKMPHPMSHSAFK
jgi:hypothetical protein